MEEIKILNQYSKQIYNLEYSKLMPNAKRVVKTCALIAVNLLLNESTCQGCERTDMIRQGYGDIRKKIQKL